MRPKDPRDLIPGGAQARLHRLGVSNLSVTGVKAPTAIVGVEGERRYEATARMGRGNQIEAHGRTAAEAVLALVAIVDGGGRKRAAAINRAQRENADRVEAALKAIGAEPVREITPACSPERPCDEFNDLHLALYGACHTKETTP